MPVPPNDNIRHTGAILSERTRLIQPDFENDRESGKARHRAHRNVRGTDPEESVPRAFLPAPLKASGCR
jgi:hypothetical protein